MINKNKFELYILLYKVYTENLILDNSFTFYSDGKPEDKEIEGIIKECAKKQLQAANKEWNKDVIDISYDMFQVKGDSANDTKQ